MTRTDGVTSPTSLYTPDNSGKGDHVTAKTLLGGLRLRSGSMSIITAYSPVEMTCRSAAGQLLNIIMPRVTTDTSRRPRPRHDQDDATVGTALKTLDDLGIVNDTIVLYTTGPLAQVHTSPFLTMNSFLFESIISTLLYTTSHNYAAVLRRSERTIDRAISNAR